MDHEIILNFLHIYGCVFIIMKKKRVFIKKKILKGEKKKKKTCEEFVARKLFVTCNLGLILALIIWWEC